MENPKFNEDKGTQIVSVSDSDGADLISQSKTEIAVLGSTMVRWFGQCNKNITGQEIGIADRRKKDF